MTIKVFAASALLAALLIGPASQPAQARIKCDGPYQLNSAAGGRIASPYCEDNYLAAVARGAGMKVSARAVRQNPHVKERACGFVGYDIRVQHICAGYIHGGRGGHY